MDTQIVCTRCVLDRSAKEITFKEGICNFCHTAQKELALAKKERPNLQQVIERIKKEGKKYDCLLGLSGGVDSATALVKAVELGLRPLAYSLDNHWNTEQSDENIMRLVETLKVPFFRYVIDQQKFLDLQSAFIKAGLVNIEIATDHLLLATSFETAKENGIKWIISGGNVATESIMPESWSYTSRDLVHIKDVYHRMTGKPLKGLPTCSLFQFNLYKWWYRIKTLYLLDYFDYNRTESLKMLQEKVGYKDYGEKHCESNFTWWYQGYYLFEKFGIDKRKAHFSSLINSGQMTREEAMQQLQASPTFPSLGLEKRVKAYPKREHRDFKTDEKTFRLIGRFVKLLRLVGIGKVDYLGT